ncbi:MAG: hypothetical protein AAGA68_11350 [Pseudomonadota bacterium]
MIYKRERSVSSEVSDTRSGALGESLKGEGWWATQLVSEIRLKIQFIVATIGILSAGAFLSFTGEKENIQDAQIRLEQRIDNEQEKLQGLIKDAQTQLQNKIDGLLGDAHIIPLDANGETLEGRTIEALLVAAAPSERRKSWHTHRLVIPYTLINRGDAAAENLIAKFYTDETLPMFSPSSLLRGYEFEMVNPKLVSHKMLPGLSVSLHFPVWIRMDEGELQVDSVHRVAVELVSEGDSEVVEHQIRLVEEFSNERENRKVRATKESRGGQTASLRMYAPSGEPLEDSALEAVLIPKRAKDADWITHRLLVPYVFRNEGGEAARIESAGIYFTDELPAGIPSLLEAGFAYSTGMQFQANFPPGYASTDSFTVPVIASAVQENLVTSARLVLYYAGRVEKLDFTLKLVDEFSDPAWQYHFEKTSIQGAEESDSE